MASMASSNCVDFRISYSGSTQFEEGEFGGYHVANIDLRLQRVGKNIFTTDDHVHINREVSTLTEQFQKFTGLNRDDDVQDGSRKLTTDRISAKSPPIKIIELSASIFCICEEFYNTEDNNLEKNGFYRKISCTEYPIFVSKLPEFTGGKCYHIKVANDGSKLTATFQEIDEMINQGTRNQQNEKARL